jgi:hypothetical protein
MTSHLQTPTAHLKLLAFLAAAFALTGCNGMTSSMPTTPATPTLSGNWQIQEGSLITWPPKGVSLVGAMQNQGSQLTGTFYTNSVCSGPAVVDYTGSIDSMGNLNLATMGVTVQLLDTIPTAFATGTLTAGALPSQSPVCNAILGNAPAIGTQIASLTGTFTGPVDVSPTLPTSPGTVTATLTQSATPNASGQFPLSGTVTFTSGTCSISTPVAGTISGLGLTLATPANPISAETVSLSAATSHTASQIATTPTQLGTTGFIFTPAPCSTIPSSSATYFGTLTRQ